MQDFFHQDIEEELDSAFFPAMSLQNFKGLPQDQTDQHTVFAQAQPVYPLPLPIHRLPKGLNEQVFCSEQKALNTCLSGSRITIKQESNKGKQTRIIFYFFMNFFGS